MSFFSKFFSSAAEKPIKALFDGLDNVTTSDEERDAVALLRKKYDMEPQKWQHEINIINAVDSNWFNSGWRPGIGWVCVLSLLMSYVIFPAAQCLISGEIVEVESAPIFELVLAMLGMSAIRTSEKLLGVSR